jgi:hypothetical protein
MWAAEGKSPEAVDQNSRFEPKNVFTELSSSKNRDGPF